MKEKRESMFEKAEGTENVWTRYDFNEAELKTMARDLLEALTKKKNLEDDLKSAVASFKSDIAEKVAKINKLSNLYGTGYESRNMPCEVFYNWEMDIKRFVRVDNGEIVKEEKIPESDRQLKIKTEEKTEEKGEK